MKWFRLPHSRQLMAVLAGLLLPTALALGQCTIVYHKVEIPTVNGWPVIGLPSNPYNLDMDGNGTTDFIFESGQNGFAIFPQTGAALLAAPAGSLDFNSYGLPLSAGQQIDSLAPMGAFWDSSANGSLLTSAKNNGAIGLFTGQIAYLGVQFTGEGQLHYGYLYLDVSFVGANAGNLLALAWDTRPDTGIIAGAVPEPTAVALFSLGGIAFWLLRRKK